MTRNVFSRLSTGIFLLICVMAAFASVAYGQALSGTVLYYSFDEGTGSRVLDGSGNNNNGVIYGTPQWSAKGKKGGCLEFNGKDNYILVPESESLDSPGRTKELTVETWLYREDTSVGGLLVKKEGSFGFSVIGWDPTRLHFGVWDQKLEYTFVETESGFLKSKIWQHVAGVCDGKTMKIYVDGKLAGSKETPATAQSYQNSNLTVGVGLDLDLKPTQGPLPGKLDELIISDKAKDEAYFNTIKAATTENFETTVSAIVKPPLTAPAKPITRQKTPSITRSADGNTVTLENNYGLYRLSLANGVKLEKLFNNYTGTDCLNKEGGGLFYLLADGQKLDSARFKVEKAEISPFGQGQKLKLTLSSSEPRLEAVLTAAIEDSPETEWSLKITNQSTKNIKVQTTFPLVENVKIGDNLKDNYYFWPFHSGWVGNKSYDLGMVYGQRLWVPVMDVFNPSLGGGVYTYAKDTTGTLKGILLRKTLENGRVGIDYNILFACIFSPEAKPQPFNYNAGLGMATIYLERELKPAESFSPAPAAIGVHPGLCLEPLKRYSEWAHKTWYKHEPVPTWLQNNFNIVAVHNIVGNTGFVKGFHPSDRFIASESINPDGRDQHLQWAGWWKNPNEQQEPDGWGDYDYNPDWGGLEPLKAEIKKCQEKGSRVTFYAQSRACGKSTRLVRDHGAEWGLMDKPGHLNDDWGAFNMCTRAQGWQDYLADTYHRIMKDTGIDGMFLDSSCEVLLCFNPKHTHSQNMVDDEVRLLKKIREAIKSVKPDGSFMMEFCGSDYFSQYVDSTWAQTFAHPYAKDFNNYDLDFFRFYFPEVKLFEWGETADTFPIDSKRCFFNGVGDARGDLVDSQSDYLAKTGQVLRENGNAIASLAPVPFVETKKEYLYANKFPIAEKTVYTLYNKNDAAVEGDLIAVEQKEGCHYVECMYDEEINAKPDGQQAVLSFKMLPWDVVCVSRLPKVLEVSETNGAFTVKAPGQYREPALFYFWDNDAPNLGTPIALNNGAGEFRVDERIKKGKLIIKLFDGEILVDEVIRKSGGVSAKNTSE